MKTKLVSWLFIAVFVINNVQGTVYYVDINCINPVAPYTNWSTAATNIQDAVSKANALDTVLVTNGIYQSGGYWNGVLSSGFGSNRVYIANGALVKSVNGPASTIIKGFQANGNNAVRCVYMNRGALSGFTLTNGATPIGSFGGGVFCLSTNCLITNCVIIGNTADRMGGGAFLGSLFNCAISNNMAINGQGGGASSSTLINCVVNNNISTNGSNGGGGGCYDGILVNCTLIGNQGSGGGGVLSCNLSNCVLVQNFNKKGSIGGAANVSVLNSCVIMFNTNGGASSCLMTNCSLFSNSVAGSGGGAASGILVNCKMVGNTASSYGGAADSATLYNCSVFGNSASMSSGGLNGCHAYNCIISNNYAQYSCGAGQNCFLYNCLLVSNVARDDGAASSSSLYNCSVIGNVASNSVGGLFDCKVYNSIVYYNSAPVSQNYDYGSYYYSSTMPLPAGINCFTNEPNFSNLEAGDFHLQSGSPCINSGNNAYVVLTNDLDGNPRTAGGTVDIGAYEFQSPSSLLSYAWAQQYNLPVDGSADYLDSDQDGMNNWQEWRSATNPTNALSRLQMLPLMPTNNLSGLVVSWQSAANVTYYLQSGTNLASQPWFTTIQSNIVGQAVITSFIDTNAVGGGPFFYRIGVQ